MPARPHAMWPGSAFRRSALKCCVLATLGLLQNHRPILSPSAAAPPGTPQPSETAEAEQANSELAPAAQQLLQGMALLLLPQTYTDDDDWGTTRKIQSGLNVDLDGLKVQTSRRWKHVNHGRWRRIDATLVSPADHFKMTVRLLPRLEAGVPRYQIDARLRLRATGRQQQWLLGTKVYSISADAVADLALQADVHLAGSLHNSDDGRRLRILPVVERTELSVQGLNIRRISHWKGGPVREFGHVMDGMVRAAARRKSAKLTQKINSKIAGKPERFEIPAGLFSLFAGSPAEKPAAVAAEAPNEIESPGAGERL